MFRERESNKYETNVLQTNRSLPVLLYFGKKNYFNTRNQNLLNHHDFAALWWRHILCKLSCFVARLSSIFGRASSIILVPILLYHSLTF